MINVKTGEIKLDDYGVIFHVDLTLEQFRNSHTPPLKVWGSKENKYSNDYLFNARIDGLDAELEVCFRYTKLIELQFVEKIVLYDRKKLNRELMAARQISHDHYVAVLKEITDFTQKIIAGQKEKLDAWLVQTAKTLPPYEYEWGEIFSTMDERYGGEPKIIIRFKKDFPEGMDYKAYYQDQRERMERLEKEILNAKPLARFPAGFSRKNRQIKTRPPARRFYARDWESVSDYGSPLPNPNLPEEFGQ
jgi:hypothetical protein